MVHVLIWWLMMACGFQILPFVLKYYMLSLNHFPFCYQLVCHGAEYYLHSWIHDALGSSILRQWHPTPVLLPGKSHGWRSLVGCMQFMGSLRVGHDRATSLSLFTFMHWRRKWQPTPVFLPGESQGRGSLVGCHLWGRTESDMTEAT